VGTLMKTFLTRNGKEIPLPCLFLYIREDEQIHCSTHIQVAPNRFKYIWCDIDESEMAAFWHLFLHDPASCLEVYFKHGCIYEDGPTKPVFTPTKAPMKPTFTLADLGLLKPTR
jgi:hypothetical protein